MFGGAIAGTSNSVFIKEHDARCSFYLDTFSVSGMPELRIPERDLALHGPRARQFGDAKRGASFLLPFKCDPRLAK